jgi:hypothetical protein
LFCFWGESFDDRFRVGPGCGFLSSFCGWGESFDDRNVRVRVLVVVLLLG